MDLNRWGFPAGSSPPWLPVALCPCRAVNGPPLLRRIVKLCDPRPGADGMGVRSLIHVGIRPLGSALRRVSLS